MMGNRLKDILTREGVSAHRVCMAIGQDKGQLSKFLNGKGNLTLARLERIADYLGYDLQLVKRKRSRKGEEHQWDASTGEEKTTGSSITGTASLTASPPIATRRRSPGSS
ncbi:MAG: helix-turn-helix transcriptional regulator [Deltaproteobacteria bacterium]|nr:helix-turn-helix transcriptional regulator [Deltaproteobacteria bacterium]